MTLEDKIKDILMDIGVLSEQEIEEAVRAIIELVKPMKRDRLVELIYNYTGGELAEKEVLQQIGLSGKTATEMMAMKDAIKSKAILLADVILKEWKKGT